MQPKLQSCNNQIYTCLCQSVPITIDIVSVHFCPWSGEVDKTLCDEVCQLLAACCRFSPRHPPIMLNFTLNCSKWH